MWKPAVTTLWLVVLIGAGPLEARGQTTASADAFGSAGLQALWDDESSLGTGGSAGGGIGVVTAFTRGRFALRPEASFWWSQPNNFIGIEFSVLASVGF